jgi:putative DNA primase/helicase
MRNYDIQSIAESFGKPRKSGNGYLCCCPVHGDSNPSLSISEISGKLLVHCHAGCPQLDVLRAIRKAGFHADSDNYNHTSDAQPDFNEYALKIWHAQTRSAVGTLVETYLKSRGYTGNIPDSLRFHYSMKHTSSGLEFPAMIAGISIYPSPEIVAIHRTYLSHDGTAKAPVDDAKRRLGKASGGAVRFGPCGGDTLWVAEGIETALSIFLATGQPTLATLSTSGMKGVILPPPALVPNLCIAADHDNPGIEAAQALAAREIASGRNVKIIKPLLQGQDFNDVLRGVSHVR